MFCKVCDYSLTATSEHRCPECGTAFDPNDPELQQTGLRRHTLPNRGIRVVGWALTAYAWLFALTPLLAWLPQELRDPQGAGPWNHPGLVGSVLRLLWWPGLLTLCFTWLPLAVFALGSWLVYLNNSSRSRNLRQLWFMLSLVACASIILYFTHGGRIVMEWWLD